MVSFTIIALYPQGKSPDTHWIGGWMGSETGMDPVAKEQCPFTAIARNRTPVAQLVAWPKFDFPFL
jgi:hypothetical protein